jgi:hypothetical protein
MHTTRNPSLVSKAIDFARKTPLYQDEIRENESPYPRQQTPKNTSMAAICLLEIKVYSVEKKCSQVGKRKIRV